jgi:hypothetical protein
VVKTGDNYAKFWAAEKKKKKKKKKKMLDDNSKVRTQLDEKHPETCGE